MATKSSLRRTWANINLDALEHNYNKLQEYVAVHGCDKNEASNSQKNQPHIQKTPPEFLGVVKADAYGHGALHVGHVLQELGARYLAVSSLDEAMELRENGISLPVLILGHTPLDQVKTLIEYDITQAVSCRAKAQNYSVAARRENKPLRVHIKVDTGMSRLGYLCAGSHFEKGIAGIIDACNMPGLEAEGIFTHFAVSDEEADWCKDYTLEQYELFCRVISAVESTRGKKFALHHCANSGAVVDYPQTYMDMVRPGILLYGIGDLAERMELRPVMTVKSAIQTIKHYEKNTRVSYGGTYITENRSRIGVLAYGYADGFPRILSNKCSVYAKGGMSPLRGKICMDMCMIDLSDLPNVDVGDEVEIFGENNSVNKLAKIADTIPYELVCNVSKRVPRYYYRQGKLIDKELLLRFE